MPRPFGTDVVRLGTCAVASGLNSRTTQAARLAVAEPHDANKAAVGSRARYRDRQFVGRQRFFDARDNRTQLGRVAGMVERDGPHCSRRPARREFSTPREWPQRREPVTLDRNLPRAAGIWRRMLAAALWLRWRLRRQRRARHAECSRFAVVRVVRWRRRGAIGGRTVSSRDIMTNRSLLSTTLPTRSSADLDGGLASDELSRKSQSQTRFHSTTGSMRNYVHDLHS